MLSDYLTTAVENGNFCIEFVGDDQLSQDYRCSEVSVVRK